MTLAGIELRYLVDQISEQVQDYYISNIYGITKDSILFKLHHTEKNDLFMMVSTFEARSTFQKHVMLTVGVTSRKERKSVPRGTMIVRTGQALGNLVVYLLEPQSEDGLTAWNFLDDHVEEGKDFPILRVPARTTLVPEPGSPKSDR